GEGAGRSVLCGGAEGGRPPLGYVEPDRPARAVSERRACGPGGISVCSPDERSDIRVLLRSRRCFVSLILRSAHRLAASTHCFSLIGTMDRRLKRVSPSDGGHSCRARRAPPSRNPR